MNFSSSGGSVEELDIIIRTLQKFGNDVVVVTAFSKNNQIPHNLPYKIVEENISATDLLGIQLAAIKLLKKYETQADFFHIDGHLFLYGAGIYRRLKGSVPVAALFNSYLAGLPDNLITSHLNNKAASDPAIRADGLNIPLNKPGSELMPVQP